MMSLSIHTKTQIAEELYFLLNGVGVSNLIKESNVYTDRISIGCNAILPYIDVYAIF